MLGLEVNGSSWSSDEHLVDRRSQLFCACEETHQPPNHNELFMAGGQRATAEREHAAEAQAASAAGLLVAGGALLGVASARGAGALPGPGSLSPLLKQG